MIFKTDRIKKEFAELDDKNPRLKALALLVEQTCDELGIDEPVITCLYRTVDENIACGGIPNSPHLRWEAFDIRSTIYKLDEIQDLVKNINGKGYSYHGKSVALYHRVNNGLYHIHFQQLKEQV